MHEVQIGQGTAAFIKRPMTVAQLSRLLGLNKKTVYDAIAAGEIPAVPIGRRLLVPATWVEQKFGGSE